MKYEQKATAPEFYNSDDSKIYLSATSGSSPFNEWYEFDGREDALEFISSTFSSQSFIDGFCEANGEYYDAEDLFSLLREQFGEDNDFSEVIEDADLSSLDVADLGDMISAESRF